MRRSLYAAILTLGLAGCLFGGRSPRAAPPVETVETTRLRADSLWQVAREQFRRGSWQEVIRALDRGLLIMEFSDPRRAEGYFLLGEAQFASNNQLQAVREFRRVADEMGSETFAPDALLRAGDAYASLWRRPELDPSYGQTALSTYREVLERYPGTTAADRAQLRIVALSEKFALKEYQAAEFYLRYKAYDSAILTLRDLVANYPRTAIVPEALIRLVEAYRAVRYLEDLRDTCQYIDRFFPDTSPSVARYCPAAAPDTP